MWWKIEEVPERELENWARNVGRHERAAKRDAAVRAAGAFIIYWLDGALGYAPGREAPEGAYPVERWALRGKMWSLFG